MEATTSENKEPLPEPCPHLAPIEHLMIGSTPVKRGEIVDVRSLITQAKRGDIKAYNLLLTPTLIQTKGKGVEEEVMSVRLREGSERRPRGGVIVDIPTQVALSQEGIEIFVEWSNLDSKNNTVIPSWKVFVLRGDEIVEDPRVLERIKLNDIPEDPFSPQKLFDLKRVEGEPYLILLLNLSKV